jgi:hypothetical protein
MSNGVSQQKKIERQPVIATEHPAETFVQLGLTG